MILYIGADHRGYQLKETIKQYLADAGYTVHDVGNDHYDENDDYPDIASELAKKVSADVYNSKGILLCGSGVGVDIVANRFPQIRSALVASPDQAMASRSDDDTNVLSLAADFIDPETAKKIVSVWLQTPFGEEPRHKRRLDKIRNLGHPLN